MNTLNNPLEKLELIIKSNYALVEQNKKLLYSLELLLGAGLVYAVYLISDIGRKAASEAKKYIGQEEIAGNKGFTDAAFDQLMREYGFVTNDQWCMHFASMIWLIRYGHLTKYEESLKYNLTPSTQTSYKRFSEDKTGLYTVSQKPSKGAIAIWQSVSKSWAGHAAIVQRVTKDGFETIEGNANHLDDGTFSQGIVAEKTYNLEDAFNNKNKNGNRLRGFIKIN